MKNRGKVRSNDIRRVRARLETACCRTAVYEEIGSGGAGGFVHCGGCGRWAPELQLVLVGAAVCDVVSAAKPRKVG